jgi:hypothetical protein
MAGETKRATTGSQGRRRKRVSVVLAASAVALSITPAAFAEALIGVNGDGYAEGTLVAVSGTGNARSSGGIAVSGTGYAWGGVAGATGIGDAGGGMASFDADRTRGDVTGTAWSTLQDAGLYVHNGYNHVETAYQAALVATAPAADVNSHRRKLEAYAENLPAVITQLVAGAGLPAPSSPEEAAAWSSSTATSADSVPSIKIVSDALERQMPWGCMPQSARATYAAFGMPSQATLYREMGTRDGTGTTLSAGEKVIQKYYRGPSQPIASFNDSEVDLMNKIVTMVADYNQGVVLPVSTATLPNWRNRGVVGDHGISVTGYALLGQGLVYYVDGSNGAAYGRYGARLRDEVWAANKALKGAIIW